MQLENHFGLVNLDIYNKENIMEEKKCNCGPDCICGCQDKKYNRTFIYHNGAESYYSNRGFRVLLKI